MRVKKNAEKLIQQYCSRKLAVVDRFCFEAGRETNNNNLPKLTTLYVFGLQI